VAYLRPNAFERTVLDGLARRLGIGGSEWVRNLRAADHPVFGIDTT
jgi:hypothetical protein